MIFPELSIKSFSSVNLDDEARLWIAARGTERENHLLDPVVCQSFVEECHRKYGTDFSYGGWMETRSALWNGSYLDEDARYVHLGVDFNVPAGTGVSADRACTVVRIDDDHPETHGWGNRVFAHDRERDVVVVFAHLASPVGIRIGDALAPGNIFARVGTPSQNGGWFPHLHVQLIRPEHYRDLLRDDLRSLDGYGREKDIDSLRFNFPDPMEYLGGCAAAAFLDRRSNA